MKIKETILPLADALRWATYHHIDSNPSEVEESRAALCDALDAADRELEEAAQVVANFEIAIKKADAENAALRSALNNCVYALNNSQTFLKAQTWLSAFGNNCIGGNDIAIDAARAALEKL